jgi:hypothetical protein
MAKKTTLHQKRDGVFVEVHPKTNIEQVEGLTYELDVLRNELEQKLNWNDINDTVNVSLSDSFSVQLGQQLVYYVKADQQNIQIGDPVMYSGVENNYFKVKVATTNAIRLNPEYLLGVSSQNISSGAFGFVTRIGGIEKFNSPGNIYQEGDVLWYNSIDGGYTTEKPVRGNPQIRIGTVVRLNQNGLNTGRLFTNITVLEGSGSDTNLFVAAEEPEGTKLNNDIWFDI